MLPEKIPASRSILLIALGYLFIFAFSFAFAYLGLAPLIFPQKTPPPVKEEVVKTPIPYFGAGEKDDQIKNILLLGYGGADHNGGFLTDSIILLSLNQKTKKGFLISVPRDIWLNLPTDWENLKAAKINEAYAIGINDSRYPNKKPEFRGQLGGGNLAKYAVSQVTGLTVDYFAAVSFDQLVRIIDILGGIEVQIPVPFTDQYYPVKGLENETCGKSEAEIEVLKQKYSGFELEKNFPCRYETISFQEGLNKMDGALTLKFVRSRHSVSSGGDFSRSQRQIAVLKAIREKLISIQAIKKIDQLYPSLADLITTDLDLPTLKTLLSFLGNPENYQIEEVNLSPDNVLTESKGPQGQYILLPKEGFNQWQKTKEFIQEKINQN